MEDIKTLLQKGIVKFVFKKTDGSLRTAYGTLYPSIVSGMNLSGVKYKPAKTGNTTYFDLEKKDWRTFINNSIISIEANYELSGPVGYDEVTKDDNYLVLLGEKAATTPTESSSSEQATSSTQTKSKSKAKTKTVLEKLLTRFPRPSVDDGGYYVTPLVWNSILTNIHKKINTLMVGPAGTGKTELVRFAAEKMGLPYHHYNIGTMTDVQASLIGSHTIDSEGHSKFCIAQFVRDIQEPGIVMLDELNRNPQALNVLTNVLDGIRELFISGTGEDDAQRVKVHPDCVFFATANIGATYTGTSTIDEALETRFDFIGVDYIPTDDESNLLEKRTGCDSVTAKTIAKIASQIRSLFSRDELSRSLSTRETLRIATKAAIGNSLMDSFEGTLCRFEGTNSEGERGIVYKIIMSM